MLKNLLKIFMGLCAIVAAAPQDAGSNTDDSNTNYSPGEKKCMSKYNIEGICVHEGTCFPNLTIAIYGDIHDSETRAAFPVTSTTPTATLSRDCPGESQWCCVLPDMMTSTEAPPITMASATTTEPSLITVAVPTRGCRNALINTCPWCVGVYRNNPKTKTAELFCGGVVVGSRFVLTAASCARAHRWSDLWVQLPSNTKEYPVNTTMKHRQFNSGTLQHNVGLLLLNEDVEWPDGDQENLGACLGLTTPLEGTCIALGFDDSDRLKFTNFSVAAENCSPPASISGSTCGRAITDGDCSSVVPGSPVLCVTDSNDLVMAGVVSMKCKKNTVLLGSLMSSAAWITEELAYLSLPAKNYTY